MLTLLTKLLAAAKLAWTRVEFVMDLSIARWEVTSLAVLDVTNFNIRVTHHAKNLNKMANLQCPCATRRLKNATALIIAETEKMKLSAR